MSEISEFKKIIKNNKEYNKMRETKIEIDFLLSLLEKAERYEKAIEEFQKEYAYEHSFQVENAKARSQWQKGALEGFHHIKMIFDKHFQ